MLLWGVWYKGIAGPTGCIGLYLNIEDAQQRIYEDFERMRRRFHDDTLEYWRVLNTQKYLMNYEITPMHVSGDMDWFTLDELKKGKEATKEVITDLYDTYREDYERDPSTCIRDFLEVV